MLGIPFQVLTTLSGWTVSSGSGVEIQRGGAGAPFDGAQLAELDGDAPSAIAQSVPTVEGGAYDLSFAYSPRPGVASDPIALWFSGSELASIEVSGEGLVETLWYEVSLGTQAGASQSRLELRDASPPDGLGGYLDAVSLAPSVP